MAEREGFEPSVPFRIHTLSRRAPSTARTSLQVLSTETNYILFFLSMQAVIIASLALSPENRHAIDTALLYIVPKSLSSCLVNSLFCQMIRHSGDNNVFFPNKSISQKPAGLIM